MGVTVLLLVCARCGEEVPRAKQDVKPGPHYCGRRCQREARATLPASILEESRSTSAAELARRYGVTRQAVSQRLRTLALEALEEIGE
jgi:hypothetical protein